MLNIRDRVVGAGAGDSAERGEWKRSFIVVVKSPTKIIIINGPQRPTGCSISFHSFIVVVEILNMKGKFIIFFGKWMGWEQGCEGEIKIENWNDHFCEALKMLCVSFCSVFIDVHIYSPSLSFFNFKSYYVTESELLSKTISRFCYSLMLIHLCTIFCVLVWLSLLFEIVGDEWRRAGTSGNSNNKKKKYTNIIMNTHTKKYHLISLAIWLFDSQRMSRRKPRIFVFSSLCQFVWLNQAT